MVIKLIFLFFLVFIFSQNNIIANDNKVEKKDIFKIIIDPEAKISLHQSGAKTIISGSYSGFITGYKLLDGAKVNCNLIGRSFQGRGFSCGFAEIEELSGICVFSKSENDLIITKWECSTAVGENGDARCKGKASFVDSAGSYSGINGSAIFEAPLIKEILKSNSSFPIIWKANITMPERL